MKVPETKLSVNQLCGCDGTDRNEHGAGARKGGKCPGAQGPEPDVLEPVQGDVVTISRGVKSALRSILASSASAPRQLDINQGTAMSPFLAAILDERFPGLRVKISKVYRRKRPAGRKKDNVPNGGEEGEENPGAHSDNHKQDAARNYGTQPLRITASGIVRAADRRELRFTLELGIPCESACAHQEGVELAPLVVNYSGASQELDDLRFAFEIAGEEGRENGLFSGAGVGSLTFDLLPVGEEPDGSVVYGVPENELRWVEDKTDTAP